MGEPLTVVEIVKRSEQGRTLPFLCRCDDRQLYYVKGRGAGSRSLWCEWLAGSIGQAFGLPIPPMAIVQADANLLDLHPEGQQLGSLPAFGSRAIEHGQEIALPHRADIPEAVQRDVLVFDWWIRNMDRMLTDHGGNPNLLWDTDEQCVAVIDHNLAFDEDFDEQAFSRIHIFSQWIDAVFRDFVERADYVERMQQALAVWPDACQNVPAAWHFADEEQTVPADFDPEAAYGRLARCTSDDFWNLAP